MVVMGSDAVEGLGRYVVRTRVDSTCTDAFGRELWDRLAEHGSESTQMEMAATSGSH